MAHLSMLLGISIKMHKRVHLRLHYGVHLRLHLSCTCAWHKCVQNGSSNGGPDAVLEGWLDGDFNVAFK